MNRPNFSEMLVPIKPYRGLAAGGLLCAFFAAAIGLATPYLFQMLIDDVFIGKQAERLGLYILSFVGVQVFMVMGESAKQYLFLLLSQSFMVDTRTKLVQKIHRLPLTTLQTRSSGDLMSMAMNDVQTVSNLYKNVIPDMASNLFRVLAAVFMLFYLDWQMTLIVFAVMPLYWFAGKIFHPAISRTAIALQETMGVATQKVNESVSGTVEFRKYRQEHWDGARARKTFAQVLDRSKRQFWPSNLSWQVRSLLFFVPAALLFYWGGREVFAGRMTVGSVIAFITYLTAVLGPINSLLEVTNQAQAAMAVGGKLFQFLEQEEHQVSQKSGYTEAGVCIALRDVAFHYEKGEELFVPVSTDILWGEATVIAGENGAGKSTLAQILAGLRKPTAGTIRYGGIHPMNDLGYVPHAPYLLSGTIEENIAFGRDVTRERVEEVCETVGLSELIWGLPQRYETLIGPGNQTLSAGQLQRLSLARALIAPPPVLLLDEALSNVDDASQRALFQAIRRRVPTVLYITHNKEQLHWADQAIYLRRPDSVEMEEALPLFG